VLVTDSFWPQSIATSVVIIIPIVSIVTTIVVIIAVRVMVVEVEHVIITIVELGNQSIEFITKYY
jgi:hypothetical protein